MNKNIFERITDSAFKYCSYCAAEYPYVSFKGSDGINYMACSYCFNPAAVGSLVVGGAYWNNKFQQHGRMELLKALYNDPDTDETIKTRVMAEILGSKEKGT